MALDNDRIDADVDEIEGWGYNTIRVFATWCQGDTHEDTSVVDKSGNARSTYMGRLQHLAYYADQKGMLIEVTLQRSSNTSNCACCANPEDYDEFETMWLEIEKGMSLYDNVIYDLSNEDNLQGTVDCAGGNSLWCQGNITKIVRAIKGKNASRLVTISWTGGRMSEAQIKDWCDYDHNGKNGVDFLTIHLPRNSGTEEDTFADVSYYLEKTNWSSPMKKKPILLNEQFPYDNGTWYATLAKWKKDHACTEVTRNYGNPNDVVGAAGWCFHHRHWRCDEPGNPWNGILLEMAILREMNGKSNEEREAFKQLPGTSSYGCLQK